MVQSNAIIILFRHLFIIAVFVLVSLHAGAKSGNLSFSVDERMELLTTVQYLADYPILTEADLQYKKDIDNYFHKFKEHNAVKLYKTIYRRYLGFDAAPTFIYYFSIPEFKKVAEFSQQDSDDYGFAEHSDTLALLIREFRNFYTVSQFHKFYVSHKRFYDSILRPVIDSVSSTGVIAALEEHYGERREKYCVVVTPMMNYGGYGPQIRTSRETILYAIVGPKRDSKNIPQFDMDILLGDLILHEFSHSFCNPIVDKYLMQLEKDSCLLAPIRASQKEQGYGRWKSCLYEHFVRANEIVLTEKVLGKEQADAKYEDLVKNGKWIYLVGLLPIVKDYTANRQQYKTEEAIMPRVVAYFDDEAKKCK